MGDIAILNSFKEGSDAELVLSFSDAAGTPATPKTLSWALYHYDDLNCAAPILFGQDVSAPLAVSTIRIPATAMTLSGDYDTGLRKVIVQGTSDGAAQDEIAYATAAIKIERR